MRKWFLGAVAFGVLLRSATGQDGPSIHLVEQAPIAISKVAPDVFLVDFGRVAFGNLSLTTANLTGSDDVIVRFGEALKDGRVDAHPPGSVRYAEVKVFPNGAQTVIVAPLADARNTKPPAVLTPARWEVLIPFRWVEVEGWPTELHANEIRRRAAFDSTWVDDAATFHSSDPMLDKVWNLCHYSVKATTFAGIFVDGDRERLPYEADAYLTQLSYYAGDADPRISRATFDRLMKFPTWPSEWAPQMVFMAYADWKQTGDKAWLAAHYDGLKTKLLEKRVGSDGLVISAPKLIRHGDIVDWPEHERDGYVFTSVNTVVNAFHLRALEEMSQLAEALGKRQEAAKFSEQESTTLKTFQKRLFNPAHELYRDGVGTNHSSLHANLFPLAFGLVPANKRPHIAQWLAGRGMAGSVYAAQFLLEGLFENGEDDAALALMTALGDRSWRHMVESGATITWEAWDQKYKPNQDWNHAWGAAPANLLPRFVLGAQPLTPGWGRALIQPHTGSLTNAEGRIPTPRGELSVSWTREKNFALMLTLPAGMTAKVELPVLEGSSGVWVDGAHVKAHREGQWWILEEDLSGTVTSRSDDPTNASSVCPADARQFRPRIQAGRPQRNGRHERMHRTLKEDTTKPPAASLRAQQSRFDSFRYVFNNERPHEGLNNQVPASLYHPSSVRLPRKLPEFTYSKGLLLRRVNNSGDISWHKNRVFLSEVFRFEELGFELFTPGLHRLFFRAMEIGELDVEELRFGAARRVV